MQDKIIGFTAGVFDMFHIGHLNLLKNAAARCDYLIVGVNSDELVQSYKDKKTIVPLTERMEIIRQIKYVDEVIRIDSLDKKKSWEMLHYDRLFIGDDWKGNPRWQKTEEEMAKLGVKVIYLPHTDGTSSTLLRDRLGDDNWGMTMKVDKDYCMSSYLTVRYVHKKDKIFKEGLPHREHISVPREKKIPCFTAEDIDGVIKRFLPPLTGQTAVFLSGGMDSAILASYLPKGTRAYTARCIGTGTIDETQRAAEYCKAYGLEHIIVDVTWEDYLQAMKELALHDGCPIVPNEPQAYLMAKRAKADGAEVIMYGNCADSEFGGMTKLLDKDWDYDGFIKRFTFLEPQQVLKNAVDMREVYEPYRKDKNGIDYVSFLAGPYAISSATAYTNAMDAVGLKFIDPYEHCCLGEPLDLARVRSGDSKYLIRELFRRRYPNMEVPEKLPMSRPADAWMKDWEGPRREEFLPGCVEGLTGEQKLLLFSLERFMDLMEV